MSVKIHCVSLAVKAGCVSLSTEAREKETRLNPRTRRVRKAILDAAVEVLLTRGSQEVTPSRVAEHADVARTTIYRHWPDQSSLLLATIDALTAPHFPASSRGSLDVDLRTNLQGLRTRLVTRDVRRVFAALASHAAYDGAFAVAQRRFIAGITQPVVDTVQAAQDRGELDAALDCQFEATLLTGPLLYDHLVMHNDITELLVEEIAARWLATHNLS